MTKEERIQILEENKEIVKELDITATKVDCTPFADRNMVEDIEGELENYEYDPKDIYFEKMDTISAVLKYQRVQGVDFLVFASSKHYGGGVWTGAKAQEEDIFLCTDLFEPKDTIQNYEYPLNGILTMDCHIIRDAKFNELPMPVNARAFFAAAPNLNKQHNLKPDFYTRMCTLTDETFNYSKGKFLIIGAWGCGVFKNDPKEVAELFKKFMPLFQDDYQGVVVAIPDERMLNIFKEVFNA